MIRSKQNLRENSNANNDQSDMVQMTEKEKTTQDIFSKYLDPSFFTEPLGNLPSNQISQSSTKGSTLPAFFVQSNLSPISQHFNYFNEIFNDDYYFPVIEDVLSFDNFNKEASQNINSSNSIVNKKEISLLPKNFASTENDDSSSLKSKNSKNSKLSTINYVKLDASKSFEEKLKDNSLKINPFILGFEPQKYWVTMRHDHTFCQIVHYFRSRLSKNTMFMYKLYNMLLLTTKVPQLKNVVGVFWVNKFVFCVEREKIARMLGLSENCVNGALFNMQGNFPTHGFIEVTSSNLKEYGLTENNIKFQVDVYYYAHKDRSFTMRSMTAEEINDIKYKNENKRIYRPKPKAK
ncbi:hypothetical protein M9Y10_013194 [Tritrichomonas musculus]|uniref:Initiator binding domain-containing protein n=1 Tax=Tritrichomonas musculus TaxID=1915356 RepID=A0ABR2GL89_9EUKA